MGFPADELVTLLHGHDFFHLGPDGERFEGAMGAFVADGTDDGAFDATHDMGFVAQFFDFLQHGLLFFAGDIGFENDDHIVCFFAVSC